MVEQAKYEVLKKIGETKIRRYPRLVAARIGDYGDDEFTVKVAHTPQELTQLA